MPDQALRQMLGCSLYDEACDEMLLKLRGTPRFRGAEGCTAASLLSSVH